LGLMGKLDAPDSVYVSVITLLDERRVLALIRRAAQERLFSFVRKFPAPSAIQRDCGSGPQ